MKTSEDQAIIRYLLGDLADSETEKIEERYFCDQAFFDQVATLEDLLIREYLDHLLSDTDVELFEKKYFRVPELQKKVAFARGLRAVAVAQRTRGYRPSATKGWRYWLAIAAPAFAAIGVVLFIAAWLVVHNASRPTNAAPMQAEHPVAGGQSGGSVQAVSETAGVLSAVVLPGLTKGAGDRPQRLLLAPGVKEVRLELDVPGLRGDLAARVDLLLVGENHRRLLWSRDGIPSVPTLTGRTVLISMKPDDLVPGDYIIYLRRSASPPDSEALESYSFGVVRP